MKSKQKGNVKVAIRIRPALPRQISRAGQYQECVAVPSSAQAGESLIISNSDKPILISGTSSQLQTSSQIEDLHSFTFDRVFSGKSTQQDVYDKLISQSVKSVLDGFNATVFAYGQTGSGKTYTMEGESVRKSDPKIGITPRAIYDIFQSLQGAKYFSIKISIIQIYNEKINDLLGTGENLKIRERAIKSNQSIYIQNLTEIEVYSPAEALNLINKAKKRRVVAQTCMNQVSSRSHQVVTLTVSRQKALEASSEVIQQFSDFFVTEEDKKEDQKIAEEIFSESESDSEQSKKIVPKKTKKSQKEILIAKLNLVDMAGCQKIKKTGATGATLQQAKYIGKSLFSLSNIVSALTKPSTNTHVPYRDSKLTHFLKDSLGGNCRTTLLAMISPSKTQYSESLSTLRFGTACKYIKNKAVINRIKSRQEARMRLFGGKMGELKRQKKSNITVPWTGIDFQKYGGYRMVQTSLGKIACLCLSPQNVKSQEYIICLHGNPSDAMQFFHFYPALLYSGFHVIAIDMPGYGMTPKFPGKPALNCRSEYNLQKSGPVDITINVMNALKIEKLTALIGYDWGAGILFSFALKYPKRVSHLISFHPSYMEKVKDQLKQITQKTLIIWVKQDQFHNWSKWKKLADKINNAKYEIIDVKPYNHQVAYSAYSKISNKILIPIIKFLGRPDPLKQVEVVQKAKRVEEVTTTNKKVTAIKNIMLSDDVPQEEMKEMMKEKNQVQEAISELEKIFYNGELQDQIYQARNDSTHPNHHNAMRLLNILPELSRDSLKQDPAMLVRLGLWENLPNNWNQMVQTSKRYFIGRQVLVKTKCCNRVDFGQRFMSYDGSASDEYVSFKGRIIKISNQEKLCTVSLPEVSGQVKQIVVPLTQLHQLNGGQVFGKDEMGRLYFQDGLRCDYSNPLVKGKLIEIAFRISSLVQNINFQEQKQFENTSQLWECTKLQIKAVKNIRKSLNLISFCNGVDRKRVGRTDNIAKMAINGQGQCHGLSSTMSAFLYPFIDILGIDLKYRGGFSFDKNTQKEVSNAVERHQWLEITCRPQMKTFLVDLWYEDSCVDENMIGLPIEIAYRDIMCPRSQLLLKNKVQPLQESDY